MAHLYISLEPSSAYWDRKTTGTQEEWVQKLRTSHTVYVGNLSFYTTEDQILEIFSKAGCIQQIVMGLNSLHKRPCGFCFVQYYTSDSAYRAVRLLHGSKFDGRVIRVDFDSGEEISESRKYGRGVHGCQWRDEFRKDFDPGRGGEGGCLDQATFRQNRKRNRPDGWRPMGNMRRGNGGWQGPPRPPMGMMMQGVPGGIAAMWGDSDPNLLTGGHNPFMPMDGGVNPFGMNRSIRPGGGGRGNRRGRRHGR